MTESNWSKGLRDAEAVFRSGLERADPRSIIRRVLSCDGDILLVHTETETASYDLSRYDSVVALGMGKAGAKMAAGLESVLGDRLSGGIVAVKTGYTEKLERITLIEASHPIPDETSVSAADRVLRYAKGLGDKTLAIVLISGGGSALLCAPYEGEGYAITLEEKRIVTKALLGSGATIQEVNTVRKHLSRIKGGRLAQALAPATTLSLILSDVVGDDLDAIASGPTVPDRTTWRDARDVIARYHLENTIPAAALGILDAGCAGRISDTPKSEDPSFSNTRNVLIGTNYQSLLAAQKTAVGLGYNTLVLTSRLTGEAREAALFFLGIGLDSAAYGSPVPSPACIIAGGETTVTLKGTGKGGRNQEMALAFLNGLRKLGTGITLPDAVRRLSFLSGGTDGSDGPTDAAGAVASAEVLSRALAQGLDPDAYLADNNSYEFYSKCGGLLMTGPTNTNVCDIQVLIIE